ncbi:MAG: hypothetical protein RLZZ628_1854 [Bacteroidota bacterium]|jgi:hypothetical protein
MKIVQKFIILSSAIGMMAGIWSCGEDAYLPSPETARIRFFHAMADTSKFAISLDDIQLGFLATPKLDTLKYGTAYPTDTSKYVSIATGARNVKITSFFKPGTALNELNVTAEKGKSYFVFATDSLSKVGSLVLEDVYSTPKPSIANVRFVNLVPNRPQFDVSLSGGAVNINAIDYKKSSAITAVTVDSNAARLNVKILKSGTQTSMLSLTQQRMSAGRSYTFVVYGYADSVGTKAIKGKLFENPF